jgi:EAL domain-containing protein (putative c-di-GMP-specific phosphodiesterase class I)
MQREFLAQLGVEKMQGFLFGRPMTAAALVEAVHAERAASVRTA